MSKECEELVLNINNNSHILKAVFVYDLNRNFIASLGEANPRAACGPQGGKYDGVMVAQRALKISHCTIKNCAKIGGTYKGYIFSYERLID